MITISFERHVLKAPMRENASPTDGEIIFGNCNATLDDDSNLGVRTPKGRWKSGVVVERPDGEPYELSIVLVHPPGNDAEASAHAADELVEAVKEACEARAGMNDLKEGQRVIFEIQRDERTGNASAVSLKAVVFATTPHLDGPFATTNPFDIIAAFISSTMSAVSQLENKAD